MTTLNKDTILQKTDGGIDFYRHVIKDLEVHTNKCECTKNPFYEDTNASLSIYKKNDIWLFKDFGDDSYKGNVFSFAANYYNLSLKNDFAQILKNINRDLNLSLMDNSDNQEYSKIEKQLYYFQKENKTHVIEYLKNRGIKQTKNIYQSAAYERFPVAVVFVNHNRTGFECRYISPIEELKSKNIPKTKFIGKKENTLFVVGYEQKQEKVFICEGAINALSFSELGFSALATFGATNIPSAELLRKYIENKIVVLAGDGDEAGERFNSTLLQIITDNQISTKKVSFLKFHNKKDANDLLMENSLLPCIENSENYIENPIVENIALLENTVKQNKKENGKIADNKLLIQENRVQQTEQGIFINGSRGWYNIANFNIYVKYLIKDLQDEVFWILELKRPNEEPEYITLKNDDWSSAGKLKKALIKKQYVFKGKDNELTTFQEFLGRSNIAAKVDILGFNEQSEAYFFNNVCIYNNLKLQPDEFGIIEINGKCFFMPYIKEENRTFKNARRFTYIENNSVSFNSWFSLFYKAHSDHAIIPVCFYISSLFFDYIFGEFNCFPLLYLKGQKGTGKSSIVRNLTALFGYNQHEISLKSPNTEKSLTRLLNQISNAILWLDEFNNDLSKDTKGTLQSIYDGGGYEKADFSNGIETKSTEIKSATALTSNYFPEDEIFFSRCILEVVNEKSKSTEQRNAFKTIENMEKNGLSCITVELLQYRNLIIENFRETYDFIFANFASTNKEIILENRMMENMCAILTAPYILLKYNKISFGKTTNTHNELIKIAKENMMKQHNILYDNSILLDFWSIIQIGYDNNEIRNTSDFHIEETEIVDESTGEVSQLKVIAIRFQRLYQFYMKESGFNKAKPKNEIQDLIVNHESFCCKKQSARFTDIPDNETKNKTQSKSTVTSAIVLNYDKLRECFGVVFEE